jgi:hypothetical protein
VEWNWQGKPEVLREKPVPVPLCPTQIPHGQTRDRTRASAVRGNKEVEVCTNLFPVVSQRTEENNEKFQWWQTDPGHIFECVNSIIWSSSTPRRTNCRNQFKITQNHWPNSTSQSQSNIIEYQYKNGTVWKRSTNR